MRLSATQLKTWRLCPRRWGFEKIDRLPRPQAKSAELGTEVHNHLERYLRDGSPIDCSEVSGLLAAAMTPILPQPQSLGLSVERVSHFSALGATWEVRIDWERAVDGGVTIGDHKTTSDFRYVVSPEDLPNDEQAILYSVDAFTRHQIEEVCLEWNYVRTRGVTTRTSKIHTRKVTASIMLHQAKAGLEAMAPDVEAIRLARGAQTANDLPPKVDACSAFGGCPFSHVCKRSIPQLFGLSIMNESLPEGVTRGPDGSLWTMTPSGEWQLWTPPPAAPQPPPAPPQQPSAPSPFPVSAEPSAATQPLYPPAPPAEEPPPPPPAPAAEEKPARKTRGRKSKAEETTSALLDLEALEPLIEAIANRVASKFGR